jgi:glycosyltransferase involved in cell wall biosynthesis
MTQSAVDDRPQIAIISDEPAPYRVHVLERIARELPEVGLHSVFTHPEPSMPWKVALDDGIRPVVLSGRSLSGRSPLTPYSFQMCARVREYLERNRVRFVVLLGYNNLTYYLLMHWAHSKGIPLLLTGDSNIFSDSRHGFVMRGLKQLYIRHVLRLVAGLMPMGTCGRAYYRLYANHDKPAFLFPYEPDYSRLAACDESACEAFRRRHEIDPARRRLLYSGRLVPVKCVDVLLDAFARILDRRPDWDLVIAGDGPLRSGLEARLGPSARSRVKWLGFLQFDELVCCYHCCHGLVIPSEREPWGLVVNEAIATGLPVVSTEVVGAAVELVRHRINGLLVPPNNVDALADALLEVTDAGRNRQFRAAGPAVLAQWRTSADPVDGLRRALQYFRITA